MTLVVGNWIELNYQLQLFGWIKINYDFLSYDILRATQDTGMPYSET